MLKDYFIQTLILTKKTVPGLGKNFLTDFLVLNYSKTVVWFHVTLNFIKNGNTLSFVLIPIV